MESHVLGRDLFPTAPETGWFTPAEAIEGKTFEIIGLKSHRIQGEAFRVFRLHPKREKHSIGMHMREKTKRTCGTNIIRSSSKG